MAFVSMVIAFLVICIGIFGIMMLAGLILTVVSAVRRRRALREGQPPHKAGLIAGIILMLLPAALICVLVVWLSLNRNDSSYVDAAEFRDMLSDGLTEGNITMIQSAFSESERAADPSLSEEIDGMLTLFGGSLSDCEQLLPNKYCDKYTESGMFEIQHFSGELRSGTAASGETYTVFYYGYCQYDGHPEQLGLNYIAVYSDMTEVYAFGKKPE